MPFVLLLLSFTAFAETVNLRDLTEKTFTRDNTYCRIGNTRLEIQIRGHASHTEPNEQGYGEYIFYYPKVKPRLLPINGDRLNTYRLFDGRGTLCSKSLGFPLDKDKVAVLFLKENRPSLDKLSMQIFDLKTAKPLEVIDTDYVTDKAELLPDGFQFQTYVERSLGSELGKIRMDGKEFVYQDRDFSYWMKYSAKGFKILPEETYKRFTWKNFFKDQKDFFEMAGWDETEKKFRNVIVYMAVNHKLKKECLLLAPNKLKLTGSEPGWRCK